MVWNRNKLAQIAVLVLSVITLVGCRISFGFTGAGSIDYSVTKNIALSQFPITDQYVYAPLGIRFNEELRNMFVRQTKLEILDPGQNADLELEGEITEYRQYNESVAADGFSARTKLVVTVNVRYTDNTNHDNDVIDQKFTAFEVYDSDRNSLVDVQDQLLESIIKQITDQIFNSTIANW